MLKVKINKLYPHLKDRPYYQAKGIINNKIYINGFGSSNLKALSDLFNSIKYLNITTIKL